MRFEWDERKDHENRRKHAGISFELATLAFGDENRLIEPDRVDEMVEQRWQVLGGVSIDAGTWDLLMVVHVYREDENGEDINRIISARWAGKNEFRRYQEQAMD